VKASGWLQSAVTKMDVMFRVPMCLHRQVLYRALSLCYACIRSSGIILIPKATFVPNFVSFVASVAELAHGEKSYTQSLTQSINHSITQLI